VNLPVLILTLSFVLLLLMNVPVAFAIGWATVLTLLAVGSVPPDLITAQRICSGIDSFALLAIPFFIISGVLMGRGGMARRLVEFADAMVGRFTGGLGHVSTLTNMLFGTISGSAAAAVSSVGGFMIPEMVRKGYSREYSIAIVATAATTGLLIPPSNVMIVYALVSGGVSVAAMFLAGLLPGLAVGGAIMVANAIMSRLHGYGKGEKVSLAKVWEGFRGAFLSLLLIVIVIGGILAGIFTATEAAAIAVVYSFVLAVVVYREVKWRDLPDILLTSGLTTAIVMILIGCSAAMSWVMAYESVPQQVSGALIGLSDNKYVLLLVINVLLLFVGTFMDMTPAVLIFTPILLPVAMKLGLHPVHFGTILVANLCIGLCTPPVGTCLFLGCSVGKSTIARVSRAMIPFFIAMIVALMLITYWPDLSLWLPRRLGLIK
jgi:tripartite ATP-independent transporter DctM subunit